MTRRYKYYWKLGEKYRWKYYIIEKTRKKILLCNAILLILSLRSSNYKQINLKLSKNVKFTVNHGIRCHSFRGLLWNYFSVFFNVFLNLFYFTTGKERQLTGVRLDKGNFTRGKRWNPRRFYFFFARFDSPTSKTFFPLWDHTQVP